MAAAGEIEMPDCAIFADTGWEPMAVYAHLNKLCAALPFPVHVVRAGNLRLAETGEMPPIRGAGKFGAVPWFTEKGGMGRRQCTVHYKIEPIAKKQRELLGAVPRQRLPIGACEVWIGISTDEAMRMKPARNRWQTNRWPLIEHGMSRQRCNSWLARAGWAAPRSACGGCPFLSDAERKDQKTNDPDAWHDAVHVDRMIRDRGTQKTGEQFMHRSLKPLDEVDFRTDEDRGQLNMFNNECEGMCGT